MSSPYISFVVKGKHNTDYVSAKFLQHEVSATRIHDGEDFTTYRCGAEYTEKIAQWFCETSNADIIPGQGFPDGTMLIYSFHD